MVFQAVLINRLGELEQITYKSLANLKTKFKSKGLGKAKVLHCFKNSKITLLGFIEGNERYINKCELPSPIDDELYYGDIIAYIVKENLTVDDYQKFWDDMFKIEDLDDTILDDELELDEEDDYDFEDGFLVRDSDIEETPQLLTSEEDLIIVD